MGVSRPASAAPVLAPSIRYCPALGPAPQERYSLTNSGAESSSGLVERARVEGLVAGTTVTTVFYVAAKTIGREKAGEAVALLLSLLDVAPINRQTLRDALGLGFADYEDAVIHEAARHAGATAIITRDVSGFPGAALPVMTPEELLKALHAAP